MFTRFEREADWHTWLVKGWILWNNEESPGDFCKRAMGVLGSFGQRAIKI